MFVFDPQSHRRVARRERLGLNSAFERLERAKRGFERPDARARAMMMFLFKCEPVTDGFAITRWFSSLLVVITEVTPK